MSDNEKTWGGSRPGAGRKKGTKEYRTVSICGTDEELLQLKEKASLAGKTLSRYVIEALLGK